MDIYKDILFNESKPDILKKAIEERVKKGDVKYVSVNDIEDWDKPLDEDKDKTTKNESGLFFECNMNDFEIFREESGANARVQFIDKEDTPESFKKLAIKVLDNLEKVGVRWIKGGPNENVSDVFNTYKKGSMEKVQNREPARAYYFRFPKLESLIGNKAKKGLELGEKVLASSGFKKGKKPSYKTVMNGNYYYIKDKTKSGSPCYFIGWVDFGSGVYPVSTSCSIILQCVKDSEKTRQTIIEQCSIGLFSECNMI